MPKSPLYPLRFDPVFKRYLWGGMRLKTVLHKPIGDEPCAESWEIADHREDQSRVAFGPLKGTTLGELVRSYSTELMGTVESPDRFPLLFKFLDAHQTLSVQVHPNDEQAARLDPPDRGKTEAWVVIDAEPGSLIYAGLKRGVDRATLERELRRGTVELCLNTISPQPGDCIFIPAGTVHALGAGLLVAEIQQSSDTTFRLFDWNRLGPDGRPRALHIEQALDVIRYDFPPVEPQRPQSTEHPWVQRLVACDKFVLDRWRLDASTAASQLAIGNSDRFHIVAVLEGAIRMAGDPADKPLSKGDTALLPAACGSVSIEQIAPAEPAVLLVAYLP